MSFKELATKNTIYQSDIELDGFIFDLFSTAKIDPANFFAPHTSPNGSYLVKSRDSELPFSGFMVTGRLHSGNQLYIKIDLITRESGLERCNSERARLGMDMELGRAIILGAGEDLIKASEIDNERPIDLIRVEFTLAKDFDGSTMINKKRDLPPMDGVMDALFSDNKESSELKVMRNLIEQIYQKIKTNPQLPTSQQLALT